MSRPKVLPKWYVPRPDRAESSLRFSNDDPSDCAAGTWRMRDGRIRWIACHTNASEGPTSEIDEGICDTIKQAQAAAEAALRAAGYEFEVSNGL